MVLSLYDLDNKETLQLLTFATAQNVDPLARISYIISLEPCM